MVDLILHNLLILHFLYLDFVFLFSAHIVSLIFSMTVDKRLKKFTDSRSGIMKEPPKMAQHGQTQGGMLWVLKYDLLYTDVWI